ncbi:MAG: hypothetical protein U9R14_00595 [Patescibacteria group bacterium]|nr:hypothetical protein [Patescibacteria group bacterium]
MAKTKKTFIQLALIILLFIGLTMLPHNSAVFPEDSLLTYYFVLSWLVLLFFSFLYFIPQKNYKVLNFVYRFLAVSLAMIFFFAFVYELLDSAMLLHSLSYLILAGLMMAVVRVNKFLLLEVNDNAEKF